jgi:hypothetical protein
MQDLSVVAQHSNFLAPLCLPRECGDLPSFLPSQERQRTRKEYDIYFNYSLIASDIAAFIYESFCTEVNDRVHAFK